jgi:hypothetical protein
MEEGRDYGYTLRPGADQYRLDKQLQLLATSGETTPAAHGVLADPKRGKPRKEGEYRETSEEGKILFADTRRDPEWIKDYEALKKQIGPVPRGLLSEVRQKTVEVYFCDTFVKSFPKDRVEDAKKLLRDLFRIYAARAKVVGFIIEQASYIHIHRQVPGRAQETERVDVKPGELEPEAEAPEGEPETSSDEEPAAPRARESSYAAAEEPEDESTRREQESAETAETEEIARQATPLATASPLKTPTLEREPTSGSVAKASMGAIAASLSPTVTDAALRAGEPKLLEALQIVKNTYNLTEAVTRALPEIMANQVKYAVMVATTKMGELIPRAPPEDVAALKELIEHHRVHLAEARESANFLTAEYRREAGQVREFFAGTMKELAKGANVVGAIVREATNNENARRAAETGEKVIGLTALGYNLTQTGKITEAARTSIVKTLDEVRTNPGALTTAQVLDKLNKIMGADKLAIGLSDKPRASLILLDPSQRAGETSRRVNKKLAFYRDLHGLINSNRAKGSGLAGEDCPAGDDWYE